MPKVLEGVVVERAAFASTAPPAMEISTPPLSVRRSKRNLSSEVNYAALAGKCPKRSGRKWIVHQVPSDQPPGMHHHHDNVIFNNGDS